MITKELFIKFIQEVKKYDDYIESLNEFFTGKYVEDFFYKTKGCISEKNIEQCFYDAFFTESGQDLIFGWLYDNIPMNIHIQNETPLFGKEKDEVIKIETIEDLWEYMIKNKKEYFIND